ETSQAVVDSIPKVDQIIPLYQDEIKERTNNMDDSEVEIKTDASSPVELTDEKDRLIEIPNAYLEYTPARVAVGRAGPRPKTTTLLKFRYDHAAAVDAVYGEVDQSILDNLNLFTVHTKVE